MRGVGTAHARAAQLSQALPNLREQARATLQRLSHMDGWSLFRRSTLYYTPAQTVPQHGDSVEPFVALFDGGKSLAGLMSKKPLGFNRKPMAATGITCVGVKRR